MAAPRAGGHCPADRGFAGRRSRSTVASCASHPVRPGRRRHSMALFQFGSNRKLEPSPPTPAPTLARGVGTPRESTVDAPCRPDAAVGAALPDPGGTPGATAHEVDESEVAVSDLNLGDDDFSSMFGS